MGSKNERNDTPPGAEWQPHLSQAVLDYRRRCSQSTPDSLSANTCAVHSHSGPAWGWSGQRWCPHSRCSEAVSLQRWEGWGNEWKRKENEWMNELRLRSLKGYFDSKVCPICRIICWRYQSLPLWGSLHHNNNTRHLLCLFIHTITHITNRGTPFFPLFFLLTKCEDTGWFLLIRSAGAFSLSLPLPILSTLLSIINTKAAVSAVLRKGK